MQGQQLNHCVCEQKGTVKNIAHVRLETDAHDTANDHREDSAVSAFGIMSIGSGGKREQMDSNDI